MAKNMTRKSIASVAAITLGLVGLSALPAQAALSSVTIAPLSGTNANFLADAGFVLQATGAGAAASEDIEYLIEGAVAGDFNGVDWGSTTSAMSTITAQSGITGTATVATQSASAKTSVIVPSAVWTAAATQLIWMDFDATDITTPTSITITAFRDDVVANDEYDAGEAKLGSYTFTVHPGSSLTASLTTADPGVGTKTASSVVKFSGVNMASIIEDGDIGKVTYKYNGADAGASAANSVFQSNEYNSTKGGFVVASASTTFAAGGVLVATPYILDSTTAGTGTTTQVGLSRIASVGSMAEYGDDHVASSGASTADAIRAGAGSFTVYTDITASATYTAAGRSVTWTIEEVSTSSVLSGTITAGGSSLTNATAAVVDDIEIATTTDATGRSSLTLNYSGLKAGDTFKATASAATADGSNATSSTTYTVVTPVFKDVVVDNYYAGNTLQIKNLDSVSVRLMIRDDFETPLLKAARLDYFIDAGSAGDQNLISATTSTGFVDVTWTDNNTADATDNLEITDVDVANAAGTLTSQTYTNTGLVVILSKKTPDTATRVVLTNTGDDNDAVTSATALEAGNARTTDGAAGTYSELVTATVYGSTGAALAGVPVTLSASGLFFGVNAAGSAASTTMEISSADTITVYTNASGVANVYYHSNKAGKYVITATSGTGSASTTAGLVVFVKVDPSKAAAISFAGSSTTAVSGSTFKILVTVTDEFGNPIHLVDSDTEGMTVTYVGDGITLPNTLPVVTNTSGQLSFSVLLGTNDTNDGTVTVTYNLVKSDGTLTELGDLTSTYTVDVNPVTVSAKKVNAGSFKGYVAVYARGYDGQRLSAKIGDDWVIVDPIANNQENGTLFRVTDFTGAGVDIAVRIYIDRVLIDTINLTTK